MRSNDKKIIFILILLIGLALFNNFIYNLFSVNNINYIVLWLIFLVLSIFLLGFPKDKSLHKVDIIQIVIIYSLCYLIFTYLLGLIFCYGKSPYSLEFSKIILNITPVIIIIILQELFRYLLVTKITSNLNNYLLILAFVILNITLNINSYTLTSALGIFECVGYLIIPSIINNLLLTYMTKRTGYLPSMIYRLIFEVYLYLVPIFPNFGYYIGSLFNIIYPAILFVRLNTLLGKNTFKKYRQKRFASIIITIPLISLLILIVCLVSGLFRYYAMAIGSNSMKPFFSKGDAVIVRKITKEDYQNLKVGDIIVYQHENKLIIHRIVSIKENNNLVVINTKGDNNNSKDAWNIHLTDIKGKVKEVVPYIGYPSIWITEALE